MGLVNFEEQRMGGASTCRSIRVSAKVRLTYVRPIPASLAEVAMRRVSLLSRHPFLCSNCSHADRQRLGCDKFLAHGGSDESLYSICLENTSIWLKPFNFVQKEGAS